MAALTKNELDKILENHRHWLNEDCDGWENMRADLGGAYLEGADLRGADLRGANLRGANLREAYLTGADLRGADLRGANLRGANLRGANLREAYLTGANLRGAVNIPFIPLACPDTGSFTAWKKASGKIVKLLVPEDAQRSSATTRKCRCNKAVVLEIQNIDGTLTEAEQVASDRDRNFIYKVGETVKVEDFDTDRWNECSTGIHFFINRQEAVEY